MKNNVVVVYVKSDNFYSFYFDYCHLSDLSAETLAAFLKFYRAHCPDRIIVNIVPADQFFD